MPGEKNAKKLGRERGEGGGGGRSLPSSLAIFLHDGPHYFFSGPLPRSLEQTYIRVTWVSIPVTNTG